MFTVPDAGGNTALTLIVSPQSGTPPKSYAVTVTRTGSAVATLTYLELSLGALSPSFSSSVIGYTSSVASSVTSITLTPTTTHSGATVTVNTATVTSGSASSGVSLAENTATTVTVVVTAQDGSTTKTYTVAVTRQPSADATLSGLTISVGSLTFDQATETYQVSVPNSVASITVTPTVAQSGATVVVDSSAVTSNQVPIEV